MAAFILAVETEVSTPTVLRTRFALDAVAAGVNEPAVVAIASLESTPSGLPPSLHTGSAYQTLVEIGSQRLVSFVPLLGRLFVDGP